MKDLINAIADKCFVESVRVTRTVRINSKGIKILVDEDVVQQIPEGQDMTVEFHDLHYEAPITNEFSELSAATDLLVDGDLGLIETATTDGLEMRLIF